ncbi:MAG: DUF488 domain-containing protein [Candidatus Micrarchaeota archaeon]|nr:DUF488 domain-containing protein [Candidatus Micrarchaeota archaeon]
MVLKLKRVYEKYDVTDGKRVLVDRLWPRGVRKNSPNVELWLKEIAPSDELRKWFAHDPKKWESFRKKYEKELDENKGVEKLLEIMATTDPVTLVYSASDTEHNNAVVLYDYIRARMKGGA